jgi:hypothetical protein
MGLDWMLQTDKPKAGWVKDYKRIKGKLEALDEDEGLTKEQRKALQRDLMSALKQVAVSSFEVIGAPQVGIDIEATEWFRREVFEPFQIRVAEEKKKPALRPSANPQWNDRNDRLIAHWGRPFEQVLQEEKGKYVVELAKEREGVAAITGFLCTSLDFRGKAIVLSVVVQEDLRQEAFDDHDPDECLDYANRLEASLQNYKAEHPDWETRHEKNDWGGMASAKDDAEAIESAVKWLRYWGSHGFGYSGWY